MCEDGDTGLAPRTVDSFSELRESRQGIRGVAKVCLEDGRCDKTGGGRGEPRSHTANGEVGVPIVYELDEGIYVDPHEVWGAFTGEE